MRDNIKEENQAVHQSISFVVVMELNMQTVALWVMTTCSLICGCHPTRLDGVINYTTTVRTQIT